MLLPWYRDAGGGTSTAWDGYWFVIAGMLLLALAGAGLAVAVMAGRPLRVPVAGAVVVSASW